MKTLDKTTMVAVGCATALVATLLYVWASVAAGCRGRHRDKYADEAPTEHRPLRGSTKCFDCGANNYPTKCFDCVRQESMAHWQASYGAPRLFNGM